MQQWSEPSPVCRSTRRGFSPDATVIHKLDTGRLETTRGGITVSIKQRLISYQMIVPRSSRTRCGVGFIRAVFQHETDSCALTFMLTVTLHQTTLRFLCPGRKCTFDSGDEFLLPIVVRRQDLVKLL